MFKSDLVDHVAAETGCTKAEVARVMNALIKTMLKALKDEEGVSLTGFGNFKVVSTKPRNGRNPRTGESIKIPGGKKIRFASGKAIKDILR